MNQLFLPAQLSNPPVLELPYQSLSDGGQAKIYKFKHQEQDVAVKVFE